MLSRSFLIFVSCLITLIACNTPQIAMKADDGSYIVFQEPRECKNFPNDNFSFIVEEIFKATTEAAPVTEMQYTCTSDALSLSKGMFDRFGPWNEHVYHPLHDVPVLLWHNVALITNDTRKYTVAIYALESQSIIYSAASIFDENGMDVFANKGLKNTFVEYFASVIQKPKENATAFLDLYAKSI